MPKPRQHRNGKASRARIGLVVVFMLFRLLDFIFLIGQGELAFSRQVFSSVITTAIWTTALLIAIWLRKSWARLILLGLLGLTVVASIIAFPMAFDYPSLMTPLVSSMLVYGGVFAWLFFSRDVRRLTSRDRE